MSAAPLKICEWAALLLLKERIIASSACSQMSVCQPTNPAILSNPPQADDFLLTVLSGVIHLWHGQSAADADVGKAKGWQR